MNELVLKGIYVALGLYGLYMLYHLFRKSPFEKEYERLYNHILTSDKFKVKGQYDKE